MVAEAERWKGDCQSFSFVMQDFAWKFSFVLFSTLGCCTRHASTHRCVSAWFRSLRWDEAFVLHGS